MGKFTGRPNSGGLKKFGTAILNGLEAMAAASHDGPIVERIREIDALIPNLQQERDHLIKSLYEPIEGLEVSEHYDPNWRKPETAVSVSSTEGRLTTCEGDWRKDDPFSKAHPGCPYKGTQHIRHEFTLKD